MIRSHSFKKPGYESRCVWGPVSSRDWLLVAWRIHGKTKAELTASKLLLRIILTKPTALPSSIRHEVHCDESSV